MIRTLSPGDIAKLLAEMREGLQVIGHEWHYLFVNDAVCAQGRKAREELLGRRMMDVYPGIDETPLFARLSRCMAEREADAFENEFRYPDGSTGWFELRVQPIDVGISILSLDISDRKRLEIQLHHAQKMEAVGRLAGGVAHDFNNVLTAITTFGRFVAERTADDAQISEDVAEILAAAGRATALVRQLLAFSRKQPVTPQLVELDGLVANLVNMLARIVGEHIEIVRVPFPRLWRVRVDPSAFEQVLVNLAVNARDAMPEGGQLTIETTNVTLDDNHSMARGGSIAPGEYVMLAITDTGCGMAPEVQEHLFEPFFTTKPVGVGTGLGLSTCYGIIRQSGGNVWVYSELGRGTTFKIYLPRCEEEPKPTTPIVHLPRLPKSEVGETILVVEDDAAVRHVVVRVLTGLGYRVLAAADGDDALELQQSGTPIDLLVSDVVLPRMSGIELATRLRWVEPRLRVLFMSGYTAMGMFGRDQPIAASELLQKPFTPAALAERVRAVLDAR